MCFIIIILEITKTKFKNLIYFETFNFYYANENTINANTKSIILLTFIQFMNILEYHSQSQH